MPPPVRCCRCNGTAKCLRCSCVRGGIPCSSCLPGDSGSCHNQPSSRPPSVNHVQGRDSTIGQFQRPAATSPAISSPPTVCYSSAQASTAVPPSASACPSVSSPVPPPLPSISAILLASIPTLQHVPKGARNSWARVLGDCIFSACEHPDDITSWTRLFMLPKCVLASPHSGHRLRWREILKLVKSRITRWQAGELN